MNKLSKAVVLSVLTLCLVCVMSIGAFAAELTDIGGHWAKEYIEYGVEKGYIKGYLDGVVETAKADGYTTTLFGRRRYIPELRAPQYPVRKLGERKAMNSPLQGTAADIIKRAMIAVDARLRAEGLDAYLILQVHDELILEAHKKDAERAALILREEMEGAAALAVPLTVDVTTGRAWLED